jgi:hypothetical protein
MNAGFPLLRQPFFFFLPDLVNIGKHFFQFSLRLPLGQVVGVSVQMAYKPAVASFPIGIRDFHAATPP